MGSQGVGHDWVTFASLTAVFLASSVIPAFLLFNVLGVLRASLVAQMVKNSPAIQETWVPSLGQEEPLEKGMATHSNVLAWKIPWTEEPGGL